MGDTNLGSPPYCEYPTSLSIHVMESMLHNHEFFRGLPEEIRTQLLYKSTRRYYAQDELIFQRGDPGDRFIMIVSGTIEISLLSLNGRKSVLNHLMDGDVLGEIAVFDGYPRSADAYAKTEVETIEITRTAIKWIFQDSPASLWQIIEILCARARNASTMFETRSANLATTRIARCLLKVAKLWGKNEAKGQVIQQHLTQADLGELSGLARENVNRHMKVLIEDGIVHYERGEFTILDMARLEELATQE